MPPADWIHPLGDVANLVEAGAKAQNLARLIAAGLPVPPGFVIDVRALAAAIDEASDGKELSLLGVEAAFGMSRIPADLSALAQARAADLGALVVRSSAGIEDRPGAAAPGVYRTVDGVVPTTLDDAIANVWSSALSPVVELYMQHQHATHHHGAAADPLVLAPPTMAVIVQRAVGGRRVVVYTRPPGHPDTDEVLVQRDEEVVRHSRGSHDPIVALALRAETAIDATTGADVELIDGDQLWVVQARPIIHSTVKARPPLPASLLAVLRMDGRRWSWDVAHNPDPLSTAQTELVELVERAGVAPFSLRVVGGYLYTARRDEIIDAPPIDRLADIERRLRELVDGEHAFDAALARYVSFYEIWARELSPLVAAAKHDAAGGARPSAVESVLLAAARGELSHDAALARLGVLSPAWDVAVPTYAERPAIVTAAIERARAMAVSERTHAPVSGADLAERTVSERTHAPVSGADLAERDDHWFARAQWMVRRALLARGAELGIGDDVFWLPFAAIRSGVGDVEATRRASGARAAAARASTWEPPLVVGGDAPPSAASDRAELRGVGAGRAVGRVVRLPSLASVLTVGSGDVIVARAITPALAVLVVGCAALISETGGMLDHGAAMARELGIPYVVGCTHAWSALDDGAIVEIDEGVVRRR